MTKQSSLDALKPSRTSCRSACLSIHPASMRLLATRVWRSVSRAINSARNKTHYVDEEVNVCQGRQLVEDANQAFNESREDIFAAISTVGQYVRAELLVS